MNTEMNHAIDSPEEKIDLAINALNTAAQFLGDIVRDLVDPEEDNSIVRLPTPREKLMDVLDQVDDAIATLGDIDV